jgi:hypothetical protein
MAGKLCNACRDMQPRAGATELAQLPSPERTRLQRLPFFIYSFLTNHAVAKKGLPSRPRRQPSALLTGTSQFQVNNQSTSRDLTPVRPLPQQKPCLTSLRLLPETSHPDAFACRNARQQTVKSDERERRCCRCLHPAAPKQTSPPGIQKPTATPYTSLDSN